MAEPFLPNLFCTSFFKNAHFLSGARLWAFISVSFRFGFALFINNATRVGLIDFIAVPFLGVPAGVGLALAGFSIDKLRGVFIGVDITGSASAFSAGVCFLIFW
jgi:hypothetical protein